jgi:hypothetical protein
MRTAIDTIAIEIMVPADDELLLPTPLASIEGVADAVDVALADARGDFDAEGFGDARTVLVGVGVGVGVGERAGLPVTTTDPLMPAWIEQWYVNVPGVVKVRANEPRSRIVPESNEPSSAVTVWLLGKSIASSLVHVTVSPTRT